LESALSDTALAKLRAPRTSRRLQPRNAPPQTLDLAGKVVALIHDPSH
jgi:hypothetical protein